MSLLEDFMELCEENDFDNIESNSFAMQCDIRSFEHRYRLTAEMAANRLLVRLSDLGRRVEPTPEVLGFLNRCGEKSYPLLRVCSSIRDGQKVLDDLQSAGDDLFEFCHDLAEGRHTPESAWSAYRKMTSFRDTPEELPVLDSLAAGEMKAHRAAWYPSAGTDFRDLIFLSGEYPEIDIAPELFIHTDSDPGFEFADKQVVYEDDHTCVTLTKEREFDRLPVPALQFADFSDRKNAGRIALFQAEIESDRFGTLTRKLIYAVCENEWFAANLLVPNRVPVETVCHIRYGSGFGGARNSGAWLLHTLKILHARNYVSDPAGAKTDDTVQGVWKSFPQLQGETPRLVPGTVIPGRIWSNHGDVTCYELQ